MRAPSAVVLLLFACGGKPPPAPTPAAAPAPHAVTSVPAADPAPDAPPPIDHAPELVLPAWRKVGVGQTVSFSTAMIDQDLDETRVEVTQMPASAKFDALTQTITWTPTRADRPKATFSIQWTQPARQRSENITWEIEVAGKPQPAPVAAPQNAMIETVLVIRQPKRLELVNKEWPIDRMLLVGAKTFQWQFKPEDRERLRGELDRRALYEQLLTALAETHRNPRLDPRSPAFDKAFKDPRDWRIVTVRPRIDKDWTELRIVYQAIKAPEPVFAMFRLRPSVEFVPPTAGPPEERAANNKAFLAMVAKHLLPDGGPSARFLADEALHGKAVAALVDELMRFDQSKTMSVKTDGGGSTPRWWLRAFEVGIATEARMGGGSLRDADGTYRSGDGWAWSALKPFQTKDGTSQAYVNVGIPGFWTQAVPSADGKTWVPRCAPRWNADDPAHVPGYEVLCRKTLGFVDLPDPSGGRVTSGRIDANNLYIEHKLKWSVEKLPLDDGRRDLGEENGMTCSQCHIRNFGMHDYGDPANVDPGQGTPKARNHPLPTLSFIIVPTQDWPPFMLEFAQHQECRGKQLIGEALGPEAAKGLVCRLAR